MANAPDNEEVRKLIAKFNLVPHPECIGWFAETYRSDLVVHRQGDGDQKTAVSSIYFLHDGRKAGSWRELKSDELFIWVKGSPIKVSIIGPDGSLKEVVIGDCFLDERASSFQVAMPAGHVFATRVLQQDSHALTACVVAPAWRMEDFKSVGAESMLSRFPQHEKVIKEFVNK